MTTPKPDDPGAPRDPRLDAAWRAASHEEPPVALDAAILAAARREVGARPQSLGARAAMRAAPAVVAARRRGDDRRRRDRRRAARHARRPGRACRQRGGQRHADAGGEAGGGNRRFHCGNGDA